MTIRESLIYKNNEEQEFVDWKFEEWLNAQLQRDMLKQTDAATFSVLMSDEGRAWLRAAFHAGAKR